jgi:hypothetical protein
VHLRDSGNNTLSTKRTHSVTLRRKPDRHVNVLASFAGSEAFCASRRSMAQKLVIYYSTTSSEVKGRSDRLLGMRFLKNLKNYLSLSYNAPFGYSRKVTISGPGRQIAPSIPTSGSRKPGFISPFARMKKRKLSCSMMFILTLHRYSQWPVQPNFSGFQQKLKKVCHSHVMYT